MPIEVMKKLPLDTWAAKNCVLAMWATLPKLPDAIDVLRAWRFDYRAAIIWAKTSPKKSDLATGIGIWSQGGCEVVIFATRGKVGGFYEVRYDEEKKKNRPHRLRPAVPGFVHTHQGLDALFWLRANDLLLSPDERKHSKKPETLQDYLESFPGPRLELFATRERPGWTCWGFNTGVAIGPWGARKIKPEMLHKYAGHRRGRE